jgi:hypothetical protein
MASPAPAPAPAAGGGEARTPPQAMVGGIAHVLRGTFAGLYGEAGGEGGGAASASPQSLEELQMVRTRNGPTHLLCSARLAARRLGCGHALGSLRDTPPGALARFHARACARAPSRPASGPGRTR